MGNRGGSNPLDRTKIKMTGSSSHFLFFVSVLELGIRTRKGIAAKRELPVEGRVGDGASRLNETAQHGGLRSRPQNPLDRTIKKRLALASRFFLYVRVESLGIRTRKIP